MPYIVDITVVADKKQENYAFSRIEAAQGFLCTVGILRDCASTLLFKIKYLMPFCSNLLGAYSSPRAISIKSSTACLAGLASKRTR